MDELVSFIFVGNTYEQTFSRLKSRVFGFGFDHYEHNQQHKIIW